MERRSFKEGPERHGKKKSHARPDRIIEKRQNWQDYLDPEEDPGLLGEADLLAPEDAAAAEDELVEDESQGRGPGKTRERDPEKNRTKSADPEKLKDRA